MYLFPIVRRETALAARRGAYYRMRYLAGGAAGIAAFASLHWASYVWLWSSTPGQFLFVFTSAIAFLGAAGSGLFLTVDSLSREKRDGTLGLLFLTELRGYDVVFGKLAAALATALSGFLTIFPIMGLSLALGGVTGEQFWRMSVSLLALLFLSLSFGMLISALFTHEAYAALAFVVGMALPSIWGFLAFQREGSAPNAALLTNPFYPAFVALDPNFGFAPSPPLSALLTIDRTQFSSAIGTLVALSFGSLLVASLVLPWCIRPVWDSWFAVVLPWLPARAKSSSKRPRRLDRHPLLRLAIRDKTPTFLMWALMAAGSIFWFYDPLGAIPEFAGLSYPLFLHYVLKWHLAFQAGRLMLREKSSGLLETLVTTPMPSGAILRGKRMALRRHFLLPAIVTIAAHAFYIFRIAGGNGSGIGGMIAATSIVVLFADFFSLSWLGIWAGLNARNASQAFLRTLAFGLALPWAPFFGASALVLFADGSTVKVDPALLLAAGVLSAIIFAGAAGVYAMGQAHYELRRKIAAA